MRGLILAHLLLCLATSQVCSGGSTGGLQVECCHVWAELNAYMVEKTGSRLDMARCEREQHECPSIRLMQRFVAESNAVLPHSLKLAPDSTHYELGLRNVTDSDAVLSLLVWAFIGRTISTPALNHNGLQHRYLEYDIQRDELSMRTPSCEFHKAVYTAMVLVSVSLLMFLLGMQIVDKHAAERREQEAKKANDGESAKALSHAQKHLEMHSGTCLTLRAQRGAAAVGSQPLAFRLMP